MLTTSKNGAKIQNSHDRKIQNSTSKKNFKKVLKKYPSIEVVIDLHILV